MKTNLVIFGITGDLSRRKLIPALSEIVATGDYEDLSIIGVSRRDVDVKELLGESNLIDRTSIHTMDLAEAGEYRGLSETLDLQPDEQALMYLAVPASAAADIVDFLGQTGLNTPNVKILFEKPFGFDLSSAQEFLKRNERYFSEEQLYRIDHYMAKEIAQYLLRLRSEAESHHHPWGADSIAAIEVVASENIGVEGRAHFYEETGALRDFIQGHLMQVLSLVLMEIPFDFTTDKLPEYRLAALMELEPANPHLARRGQYEGYQGEVEKKGSLTETFASIELFSNDPNWQGVPLRLSTGKALDEKRSYVTISFRDGTSDTFEEGKIPIEGRMRDAYERVIVEAIEGNKSIFTTDSEVLQSWKIVAPVQEDWAMNNDPLELYARGTSLDDLLS